MQNKINWPAELNKEEKALLVLSGGMDSAVLLKYLLRRKLEVYTLTFDYGSRHNAKEIPMACELCKLHGLKSQVIQLPFIRELFDSALLQGGKEIPQGEYNSENIKDTVVPFRNGIFLSIAAGFAESNDIGLVLIASHAGDHAVYPDCRPIFTDAFSRASELGTYRQVRILAPFTNLDKREIADLGRELSLDFSRTWTCYQGGDEHCGLCASCRERKYALRQSEGLDPTRYQN
jgi:7-cyano-7-deazaguanine synthase